MGRYIRKSKPVGEAVIVEVAQSSSSLGVRTRAKTLALKQLQNMSAAVAAVTGTADGGSYLQLRNRRLAKPPIPNVVSKRRKLYLSNSSPSSGFVQSRDSGGKSGYRRIEEKKSRSSESGSTGGSEKVEQGQLERGETEINDEIEEKETGDLSIEASFGENMVVIDGKERGTRESTPISLIRDPQMVTTPGSTTRPERSSRINSMRMHSFPTTEELDLFFADSEQLQQKQFIEKYNFDPAKDEPLPGRFKWVKPNL